VQISFDVENLFIDIPVKAVQANSPSMFQQVAYVVLKKFSKIFHWQIICGKLATKLPLQIPPHIKRVATLSC